MNGPGFGGNGGSVFIKCREGLDSLSHIGGNFRAPNGGDGGDESVNDGNSRGLHADDTAMFVPPGTILRLRVKTGEKDDGGRTIYRRKFIYQFLRDCDSLKLCQGGAGGVAPSSFKKKDGRLGTPGEKKKTELEYRLVSDCALIGDANSGKTSLLGAMTSVLTRIGPEPFSTVRPHVGVVGYRDGLSFRVADLPPLYYGIDDERRKRLLRHMWRSKVLVYVVDMSREDGDAYEEFIRLYQQVKDYDPRFFNERKFLVVGTKCDALNKDALFRLDSLHYRLQSRVDSDAVVVGVSARFGLGIKELVDELRHLLYPEAVIPSYRERLQNAEVAALAPAATIASLQFSNQNNLELESS